MDYTNYFKNRGVEKLSYGKGIDPELQKVLPKRKDIAVLDVGCGLGNNLDRFHMSGYTNVTGIDINNEGVARCIEKGYKAIWTVDSMEWLDRHRESWDVIILTHVLEHMDRPIEYLRSIRRSLKPGGLLYIAVPNALSPIAAYSLYEDITHYRLYTVGSLDHSAKLAGFSGVSVIDRWALSEVRSWRKPIKYLFLRFYIWRYNFWNRICRAYYHPNTDRVYTSEIRVIAIKGKELYRCH